MAVEIVVLTPVLVMLMLLIVAFGRYVDIKGEVEALSRDAARAASLERSFAAAYVSARRTVRTSTPARLRCAPVRLGGPFVAGGTVSAFVRCEVSYSGLGLIGLPGSIDLESRSVAPIDTLRSVR
jgi:Flp pilus assembly protein TadG